MRQKSTHSGACQLCGHTQKLPGERLSLHGYSVKWNCFTGTCPGSRELPYELSCDLLPPRAKIAHEESVRLFTWADEVAALTEIIWLREEVLIAGRRERTWKQIPVANITIGLYGTIEWTGQDGRKNIHRDYNNTTPEKAVSAANAVRAEITRTDAKHYVDYAKWCERRAAEWTLKSLQANVPEKPKTPKCSRVIGQTYTGRARRCGKLLAIGQAFLCVYHAARDEAKKKVLALTEKQEPS